MTEPLPLGRLRALARTADDVEEPRGEGHRCDLCGEALPAGHRHLLELSVRRLACACRACALLFDRGTTDTGRYRTVPELRERLADDPFDDVGWAALGVPVRLAFLVPHDDGVTAHYPSPLGVVGTDVEREAWEHLVRRRPELARLVPEVTALLVHRAAGEHWLVGIDECYRLTARVRGNWTGMTGGDEVWREIDRFFAELRSGVAPG